MDETLREFLIESREGLDRMDQELLSLEKDSDAGVLASVFRTIHTLKGTAGFLGFRRLAALAHAAEELLARLRDGSRGVDSAVVSALLATVDACRRALVEIENGADDASEEHPRLIATLTSLQRGAAAPAAGDSPAAEQPRAAETSIRVDIGILDRLMNLVGELVLARNQILQLSSGRADAALAGTAQRLNLITSELQEGVMKTRMQPIGNVWSHLPRLVRDVAQRCGKRVRLEMNGRGTELDRTILEAIKDPLVHLVRNAIDHGIESPDARATAGKPPEGKLSLRSYHEGGQVIIEVEDDGAGVDIDRLREAAVRSGVASSDAVTRMQERDVVALVFAAGLSTAQQVTDISGRGVGLDVVRANVEKIGGTVDIASRPGRGTTFTVRIPLTLAIIPALVVTVAGDRFAIPQVNLLELVRLEGDEGRQAIEKIHGASLLRLRGQLLPLIHLAAELGLAGGSARAGHDVDVVIVEAEGKRFGVIVDAINDTEEIVVKPLGKQLKSVDPFSGATIMGDGSVALILDVLAIADRLNVSARTDHAGAVPQAKAPAEGDSELQSLLLCRVRDDGRIAIPLGLVSRLEEFPRASLERAGGREVVQYRGRILPLVHLSDLLPERRRRRRTEAAEEATVHVVVHRGAGRDVGLVVDRILDIVHDSVSVDRSAARRGVVGCAVLNERVTEVLDLRAVAGEQESGHG